MAKNLEAGIKELVEEFQSNGSLCTSKQTIAERRASYIGSTIFAGDSPKLESEFLDVLKGIQVKVYKPTNEDNLSITIYFHGGCFISGGFETHEIQLRQLALLSNSIVICIKYRLAPEHTYPAAHDDVYHAVIGVKEHGHKYGGDSERIAFVGDSAGGHLALATTLRLKKLNNWLPQQQILIYPMLDPRGSSLSYREYGTDYVITAEMLLSGFKLYANNNLNVIEEPELSLLKQDFSGLPTTTIITAEFDPLRDEGEQLFASMLSQGVDAYCERYSGVIHGFFQLSGICDSAKRCVLAVSKQLKNNV